MNSNPSSRIYIAIDLKSYYASAECADRSLDPLTTNLVVADLSRTEKTICLAVSPSLKALGIPGRPRLFEVVQKVNEINQKRLENAIKTKTAVMQNGKASFSGKSFDAKALEQDPSLELSYIVAPPRMARYEEISSSIYGIYLKYIAPEDILVYSIDEVFMDVTEYLPLYQMSAHELAMTMIREVLYTTGITATAGIGTNLYLAKIAMDIVAKHSAPDKDGVRIAELNETSYRELLWDHTPITDFWRVGSGYAKKLHSVGLETMGDIARCSLGSFSQFYNEDLLYGLFGVNAELLIDHAWGWEPVTMVDIKAYHPDTNSISTGQVLPTPYSFDKGRLIIKEMTDTLVLDLVKKGFCTRQLTLTISYDKESLTQSDVEYHGPIGVDHYGRKIPRHAHGTVNLAQYTSGTDEIMDAVLSLYDRIVNRDLLIRRINITACNTKKEQDIQNEASYEQLSLFDDPDGNDALSNDCSSRRKKQEKEKQLQNAVLEVRKRYGKNAIVKGMNLEEGGRERERNNMIGGHKA